MKQFKRILLRLLAVLGILILLLPLSILIDSLADAGRVERITNTSVPGLNGGPDIRAYVARPEGQGPFPVVIMIHEFYGLNESILSKADLLAQEGYLVIAPDTFRGSTTALIPRAIWQVINTNQEDVNVDLDSVYTWLETQPEADAGRIAIVGFCYGGRVSLLYSLHNPSLAATVVFYGSSETDPQVLKNLPGPVLGIFGGADQSIPLEEVTAFKQGLDAAGVPHQVTVYEGQPHAFVEDAEGVKMGGAQADAWNEMLIFLEDNLKASALRLPVSDGVSHIPAFPWRYYAMLAYEHTFGSGSHH
jgi:carboxymethylenebutenolidase